MANSTILFTASYNRQYDYLVHCLKLSVVPLNCHRILASLVPSQNQTLADVEQEQAHNVIARSTFVPFDAASAR